MPVVKNRYKFLLLPLDENRPNAKPSNNEPPTFEISVAIGNSGMNELNKFQVKKRSKLPMPPPKKTKIASGNFH